MPKIREAVAERPPLSKERIVQSAVDLADRSGVAALTMRKLGEELGVEAMSLYHHVANKEDVLDGMADIVFSEIELPRQGEEWHAGMRRRALSAREALLRHPWAIGLLESRMQPGPATLRHHDAVIGCLRESGFSLRMAAHAYALLDSYVYGFAMQQANLPFRSPEEAAAMTPLFLAQFPAAAYPHLAEFTLGHVLQPGYDFGAEFEFGLDLVLDGLERVKESA